MQTAISAAPSAPTRRTLIINSTNRAPTAEKNSDLSRFLKQLTLRKWNRTKGNKKMLKERKEKRNRTTKEHDTEVKTTSSASPVSSCDRRTTRRTLRRGGSHSDTGIGSSIAGGCGPSLCKLGAKRTATRPSLLFTENAVSALTCY